MSGEEKDKLQGKIGADGVKRWSEHTRALPELQKGDTVQIKNLRGKHPLQSDHNGIVVRRKKIK